MARSKLKEYEGEGTGKEEISVGNSEMVECGGADTESAILAAGEGRTLDKPGMGVCMGLDHHDGLAHEDWDKGLSKGGGIDRGQGAFPTLLPTLKETTQVPGDHD